MPAASIGRGPLVRSLVRQALASMSRQEEIPAPVAAPVIAPPGQPAEPTVHSAVKSPTPTMPQPLLAGMAVAAGLDIPTVSSPDADRGIKSEPESSPDTEGAGFKKLYVDPRGSLQYLKSENGHN